MEEKQFKKYEKALLTDLSRVEKYSEYVFGEFIGGLEIQKIWLELNESQFKKLEKYIKETFSLNNFNWFGKRKDYSCKETETHKN